MIHSHTHQIDIWIRDVCDKHIYDPNEDFDEHLFWTKWQAPRLLVMKPSRYQPYVAGTDWERFDAATSLSLRKAFAENYVLHLENPAEKGGALRAIELAKQPQPALSNRTEPTVNSAFD